MPILQIHNILVYLNILAYLLLLKQGSTSIGSVGVRVFLGRVNILAFCWIGFFPVNDNQYP